MASSVTLKHSGIVQRQIGPVSVNCDGVGSHVLPLFWLFLHDRFWCHYLFYPDQLFPAGGKRIFQMMLKFLNDIEHLNGRLNGGLRLIGIQASGFEPLTVHIPENRRLHEGIRVSTRRNRHRVVL